MGGDCGDQACDAIISLWIVHPQIGESGAIQCSQTRLSVDIKHAGRTRLPAFACLTTMGSTAKRAGSDHGVISTALQMKNWIVRRSCAAAATNAWYN
jgi:hypothetical protein